MTRLSLQAATINTISEATDNNHRCSYDHMRMFSWKVAISLPPSAGRGTSHSAYLANLF